MITWIRFHLVSTRRFASAPCLQQLLGVPRASDSVPVGSVQCTTTSPNGHIPLDVFKRRRRRRRKKKKKKKKDEAETSAVPHLISELARNITTIIDPSAKYFLPISLPPALRLPCSSAPPNSLPFTANDCIRLRPARRPRRLLRRAVVEGLLPRRAGLPTGGHATERL